MTALPPVLIAYRDTADRPPNIAAAFGISEQHLYRLLKKHNVGCRRPQKPPHRVTLRDHRVILAEYGSTSAKQIAHKLGMCPASICETATRLGMGPMPASERTRRSWASRETRWSAVEDRALTALYRARLPLELIAEFIGRTPFGVQQHRKARKLTRGRRHSICAEKAAHINRAAIVAAHALAQHGKQVREISPGLFSVNGGRAMRTDELVSLLIEIEGEPGGARDVLGRRVTLEQQQEAA